MEKGKAAIWLYLMVQAILGIISELLFPDDVAVALMAMAELCLVIYLIQVGWW